MSLQSHVLLLVLFSLSVSIVFAVLMQDGLKAQLRFGAVMCAGLIVCAVVLGWLMYPFPL
jgi:undecaprenyl pyrophosphate phosphatase UppP